MKLTQLKKITDKLRSYEKYEATATYQQRLTTNL